MSALDEVYRESLSDWLDERDDVDADEVELAQMPPHRMSGWAVMSGVRADDPF